MIENFICFMFEKIIIPGFLLLIIFAIPFVVYIVYRNYNSPSLSLTKSHWDCSQSVLKSNTTYVMSGNVMVPITTQDLDCVQWTKKGYGK